jgi:hypothetical protein
MTKGSQARRLSGKCHVSTRPVRSKAAADRLRCSFTTIAVCYGLMAAVVFWKGDWGSGLFLAAVVALALIMRALVHADGKPTTDPEDDLVACICKGVDEYNRRHPELTVFETLNGLSTVSDMLTKVFIEQGEKDDDKGITDAPRHSR